MKVEDKMLHVNNRRGSTTNLVEIITAMLLSKSSRNLIFHKNKHQNNSIGI
jgi:hypothetical protein